MGSDVIREEKIEGRGLTSHTMIAGDPKKPAVLLLHGAGPGAHAASNWRHLMPDLAENFFVIAPDMLSLAGGTPPDEDQARDMIGKLDLSAAIASALVLGREMKKKDHVNGKLGIVGFCWGGAFLNRYAVAAGGNLDAGVAYYGPAPDPAEADKVKAPLLLHYAGLDKRVAQTGAGLERSVHTICPPWSSIRPY